MKSLKQIALVAALMGSGACVSGLSEAAAQTSVVGPLARKAMLGVAVEPAPGGGARILQVGPGSTVEQAGLKTGDVITAVNGDPTADNKALVVQADKLRAGQKVKLSYTRDGKAASAETTALPRPMETYQRAKTVYGAVPFQGGLLRDIMVTPEGAKADDPVVYLIQGYYCGTMEGVDPKSAYHNLAQGLADRGIGIYRVEKPGMGDSQGGPACVDTDFDTEMAAFREGLKTLTGKHGVAPGRIVLLGHSMGGVEAPLLAAETKGMRGIAVYGGVMRNWHDYMQDLFRLQSFYSMGMDPAENEDLAEAMRPILNRIFLEDVPLSDIAKMSPEADALLKEALWWDGGDQMLGRSVSYWRGVGQQRLATAWRDAEAPTLAIYGEVDYAAIDDRDHKLIVDVVNHYRPGTAKYATLARTGHGMGIEGTPAEARAGNLAADGQIQGAAYNAELTTVLGDWIASLS